MGSMSKEGLSSPSPFPMTGASQDYWGLNARDWERVLRHTSCWQGEQTRAPRNNKPPGAQFGINPVRGVGVMVLGLKVWDGGRIVNLAWRETERACVLITLRCKLWIYA